MGSKGGSFFTEVTHTASTITFTFEDGTSITLKRQTTPPASPTLEITDAKAGTNAVEENTSRDFTLSQANVESLTIIKPDGWQATVSGNTLTVTAPDTKNPYAEETGTVTLIGLSASGQAATVSMTVGAGIAYTRGDGSFLDVLVKNPDLVKPNNDGTGEPIKLDGDGDGFILLSDAARVKWIDVWDQGLTSLSGLAYFPALESLNCSDNNLTGTLDVSGCENLRTLLCDTNPNLSGLDVSGCENLQRLDCGGNANLSTLDVSGCESLQDLRCYNTDLSTLDVSNCESLQELRCSNTKIDALDVSDCVNLQRLYCSWNPNLSTLDVSGCGNLQTLECSNSALTGTLDVSTCTGLEFLECGNFDENEADPKLTVTVAGGTDLVTSDEPGKLYVRVCYDNGNGWSFKDYGDMTAIGTVVSGVKVELKAP